MSLANLSCPTDLQLIARVSSEPAPVGGQVVTISDTLASANPPVSLTPSPVVAGNVVNGTAKLECKAGPGDMLVELASTLPAVAKITKPKIVATGGGITKSKTLTVTP